MEGKIDKPTSKLANAALWCAFVSVLTFVVFGLMVLIGFDIGHLIALGIIIAMLGFLLSLLAILVISCHHKTVKGLFRAFGALIVTSPVLIALMFGILIAAVRNQRERENTGLYNMRLIGMEMKNYATTHNGLLPDANNWCDELIEHNPKLNPDNFRDPRPDIDGLMGDCHFAFNKNLSGLRLSDIPNDVVLLFEADGVWNLHGGSELLETRNKRESSNIAIMFADQTIARYWFYTASIRKFERNGKRMYYEQPRWSP